MQKMNRSDIAPLHADIHDKASQFLGNDRLLGCISEAIARVPDVNHRVLSGAFAKVVLIAAQANAGHKQVKADLNSITAEAPVPVAAPPAPSPVLQRKRGLTFG